MRNFMSAMLVFTILLLLPLDSFAGRKGKIRRANKSRTVLRSSCSTGTVTKSNCSGGVCTPARTVEKTKTVTKTRSNVQAQLETWCKEECRLQAQHGMGHYRGVPTHLGAWFCGVGIGSNSCHPHSGPPKAAVTAYGHTTRVW